MASPSDDGKGRRSSLRILRVFCGFFAFFAFLAFSFRLAGGEHSRCPRGSAQENRKKTQKLAKNANGTVRWRRSGHHGKCAAKGTATSSFVSWRYAVGPGHSLCVQIGGLVRLQIDGDLQLMRAAAQDHALNRTDVAVIPAPAQQHVLIMHHDPIGRIQVHPAMLRSQPCANPGVRLVGPLPAFLARRWLRADVAGVVSRRYAKPPQRTHHQVGKILAHALSALHDLNDRALKWS